MGTDALEAAEFAAEMTVGLAFDEIEPGPTVWVVKLALLAATSFVAVAAESAAVRALDFAASAAVLAESAAALADAFAASAAVRAT